MQSYKLFHIVKRLLFHIVKRCFIICKLFANSEITLAYFSRLRSFVSLSLMTRASVIHARARKSQKNTHKSHRKHCSQIGGSAPSRAALSPPRFLSLGIASKDYLLNPPLDISSFTMSWLCFSLGASPSFSSSCLGRSPSRRSLPCSLTLATNCPNRISIR